MELEKLSDWKLKKLIKDASAVRHEKYRAFESREPKYGDISRSFSELELEKFFSAFIPEEYKHKVLFLVMRWTGRRIGEACSLRLEQLDFDNKYIKFQKNKVRYNEERYEFVRMVEPLFFPLLDYSTAYRKAIEEHGGFLFFSKDTKSKTPHLTYRGAADVFRRVCERANLADTYGYSTERMFNRKKRRLFRLSTHSFRHTLIERALWQKELPPQFVSKMVGHKSIQTTMDYAKKPPKELIDRAMEQLAK